MKTNFFCSVIIALLVLNLCPVIGEEADNKEKEDLNWIGFSFGLPISLQIGIADAFAEDIDFRIDGFISHDTDHTLVTGLATSAIYSPDIDVQINSFPKEGKICHDYPNIKSNGGQPWQIMITKKN